MDQIFEQFLLFHRVVLERDVWATAEIAHGIFRLAASDMQKVTAQLRKGFLEDERP